LHSSDPNARQIWAGCGCGDFVDFGAFKTFLHGIEGSEIAVALGPFKEVPVDFNATIGAKSMSAKCDMGDVFDGQAEDDERTFSTDPNLRENLKRVESTGSTDNASEKTKAEAFKAAAAEKATKLKEGAARGAEIFREGAAIAATNLKNGSARLVKQVSDMAHNMTASPDNSEDEAEEDGEEEGEAGAAGGGGAAAEGGGAALESADAEAADTAGPVATPEPSVATEPATSAAAEPAQAAAAEEPVTANGAEEKVTDDPGAPPPPALTTMASDSCLIHPNAPIEG